MATKIQSRVIQQAGLEVHTADCPNCGRRHSVMGENTAKHPRQAACACGMLLHLDTAHDSISVEQFHAGLRGDKPAA